MDLMDQLCRIPTQARMTGVRQLFYYILMLAKKLAAYKRKHRLGSCGYSIGLDQPDRHWETDDSKYALNLLRDAATPQTNFIPERPGDCGSNDNKRNFFARY
jgi:hypothetical protein